MSNDDLIAKLLDRANPELVCPDEISKEAATLIASLSAEVERHQIMLDGLEDALRAIEDISDDQIAKSTAENALREYYIKIGNI